MAIGTAEASHRLHVRLHDLAPVAIRKSERTTNAFPNPPTPPLVLWDSVSTDAAISPPVHQVGFLGNWYSPLRWETFRRLEELHQGLRIAGAHLRLPARPFLSLCRTRDTRRSSRDGPEEFSSSHALCSFRVLHSSSIFQARARILGTALGCSRTSRSGWRENRCHPAP